MIDILNRTYIFSFTAVDAIFTANINQRTI